MIIRNSELILDTDLCLLEVKTGFFGDGEVKLTETEVKLLVYLLRNAGKVCTRQDISVFGLESGEWFVYDRKIDVHIASIRKKIGLGYFTKDRFIKTARGKGYYVDL